MKIILALLLLALISEFAIAKDQVLVNKAEAKPKKGSGGKFHNSIGLKVDKSMVLDAFPFKVTRCDQIVLFKAKYIHDMGDYRFRKDGFFTLTAYYVNQFLDKDAKKLDESILLTESKRIPQHLKGARGCIYVDGGPHRNDIAICLGSKVKAQNILNVLNDFERCRLGDNLQPIPKAVLQKLIRTCLKGKGTAQGKGAKGASKLKKGKGKGKKKLSIKVDSQNPWRDNRKKYFHPLKLRVPGTRR